MARIKKEDVAAVWVDEEFVCPDCLSDDDEIKQDSVLTQKDLEDDEESHHFCDRCNKKI